MLIALLVCHYLADFCLLLDKDIIILKQHFAYVGMPVIIQGETDAPLPWELRARQRAGN